MRRTQISSVHFPLHSFCVTGSLDSTVRIWKASVGEVTCLSHHRSGVRALHFLSNLLATGGNDKTVSCVDISTEKIIDTISCDFEVFHLKLRNASQLLGVATKYDVTLVDLRTPSKMRPAAYIRPFTHNVQISGFELSDHLILCGGFGAKMRIFDWRKILNSANASTLMSSFQLFDEDNISTVLLKEINGPAVVNAGPIRMHKHKIVFGCQFANEMQIWDTVTFQCIRRISSLTSPVKSFKIEDSQLITASYDGIIRVWHIKPLIPLVDYC
jgi:WD40 repeat protein